MGTFDWHSDINQLEPLRGPDELAAFGLFVRAGSWTSAAGGTGFVTDEALEELHADVSAMSADIARLVEAGLWERAEGGYRMLRGPRNDPGLPMPLWRYSDTGGRLVAVDDMPNTRGQRRADSCRNGKSVGLRLERHGRATRHHARGLNRPTHSLLQA